MAENFPGGTKSGLEAQRLLALEMVAQYATLRKRARQLTSNAADAADLVQDTLVLAMKAFRKFKRGANLRAWLHRIMHNVFVDRCRSRKRARGFHPGELDMLMAPVVVVPTMADVIPQSAIEAAIDDLQPFHREIFRLAYLDHVPHREIARRLGIPQATTGVRLWRAKNKVRHILEAKWGRDSRSSGTKSSITSCPSSAGA